MMVQGQAKVVQGTGTHHIETDHLCVCVCGGEDVCACAHMCMPNICITGIILYHPQIINAFLTSRT